MRTPRGTAQATHRNRLSSDAKGKKSSCMSRARCEGCHRTAEHAAEFGAHAISSLPPVGNSTQVLAFYEELAKESALPLILYYFS